MEPLLLWVPVVLWLAWGAQGRRAPVEGVCSFSRVYKMKAADCAGINLSNIPTSLSTRNLEILDASLNRIRFLKNTSFIGFHYLRFLYLGDNSIHVIEPGTFEPLSELEVLDLSVNAIRDLPSLLPETLKRLYLSDNPIEKVHLSEASSLQFLALGDCFLTHLPDLGELPLLKELNVTGNPLTNLTVGQLASFCNLEVIRIPESLNQDIYTSSCECVRVNHWAQEHSINISPPLNCTVPETFECETNATEEAEVYAACQVAYQQHAATHWTLVSVAAIVVVLCVIFLTVLWRRKWRKRPSPKPSSTTIELEEGKSKKLLNDSQTKPRF